MGRCSSDSTRIWGVWSVALKYKFYKENALINKKLDNFEIESIYIH